MSYLPGNTTQIVLYILFAICLLSNSPIKLNLSTQSTFVQCIHIDGMSNIVLGEWNNIDFDLFALIHSLLTCSIPTHGMILMINILSTRLTEVCSSGRTEKLCVQYFKLVAIIRLFIRAELCGDWQYHVHSVWLMISYLHAAVHLHQARSAQLYLQYYAQPGKQHGTRRIRHVHKPVVRHRATVRQVLVWHMDRHDSRTGTHAISENVRRFYSWARHIAVNYSQMSSFDACNIQSNRRYGNLQRSCLRHV